VLRKGEENVERPCAEYGRRRAWLILAPILWLGCTVLAAAQAPPTPAGYPPFSWDTVPIAADFGKAPDQFTQEEGLFIARHFSLVSIEKGQAVGPSTKRPPYTEAGFLDAVPLIKLNNPKVKILFYWNTQIAFFRGCAPYCILRSALATRPSGVSRARIKRSGNGRADPRRRRRHA
jgi:hypothetical protein